MTGCLMSAGSTAFPARIFDYFHDRRTCHHYFQFGQIVVHHLDFSRPVLIFVDFIDVEDFSSLPGKRRCSVEK